MCVKFKFVVTEYCYLSLKPDLMAVAHEKAQAEVGKQEMFSLEMRLVHSALSLLKAPNVSAEDEWGYIFKVTTFGKLKS